MYVSMDVIRHLTTPTQCSPNVIMQLFAIGTFKCDKKEARNPCEGPDQQVILIV